MHTLFIICLYLKATKIICIIPDETTGYQHNTICNNFSMFKCNWAGGTIQGFLNGRGASLNIKNDKYILASTPWASKCQSINNQWSRRADSSEYQCVLLAVPRRTWNGWKEGKEMLSATHMHKLNPWLPKARTRDDKKKKGLQKNKMMSIAKQDCDGESQNTHRYLDY